MRIYWDLGWSWSDYHQSCERINRITRKLPITGYVLISSNTVEEMIWKAIARKMELASLLVSGGTSSTAATFAQHETQEVLRLWDNKT